MKLTELNPEWNDDDDGKHHFLNFECPKQHKIWEDSEMKCHINIPVKESSDWHINGADSFDNLTITPSIWHHCKEDPHFFITNGEIVYA